MKTNDAAEARSALHAGILCVLAMLLLSGCGGGSGSGAHQSASLSYSPSSLVFTVGTAITPATPTITGTLTSFTVAPALPQGLILDPTTGVISGTPSAITAVATYTVSASGMGAAANAQVSITVNDQPPSSVNYATPAITFTTGIAAQTFAPTASGGKVVTWSVNPALPAGLNLDPTDGAISGTPTTATPAGTYVVTAQNSGGKSAFSLTIEVDAGPLLQLGHVNNISLLRISGTRVLSLDDSEHWVLWDYASAGIIASGNLSYDCISPICGTLHLADLAGGTVVLETQSGFELRSADTGAVVAEISAAGTIPWWSLASDGSYLAIGTKSGLSLWSSSGDELASRSGDYSAANAFATPGALLVAIGPAGQNVIETLSLPGATDSTGPSFNGQFSSWFLDGSRFITTAGSSTLVYSSASTQQAVMTLPSTAPVTGQGNWIWTASGPNLNVYPIASGSSPAATFNVGSISQEIPSGTTIGVVTYGTAFSVIDLSGTTPSETNFTLPIDVYPAAAANAESNYFAASTSQWLIGNSRGVILDGSSLSGTPRYLGYGAAWSIAGGSGYFAVATASGTILYFDSNTLAQVGTIADSASKIVLSSDGSVLAAAGDELDAQYHNDLSINIYSLPGAGLTYTWPYSFSSYSGGGAIPRDIELSGSGAELGQVLDTSGNITIEVTPPTGGTAIYSTSLGGGPDIGQSPPWPLLISPDGSGIATSDQVFPYGGNIVENGTLVTAVSGLPIGWIDDDHLLVNNYTSGEQPYQGCTLYSAAGQSTGTCALPEVTSFQAIGPDSIFAVKRTSILSVSTGNVTWMSGDPASTSVGAVAGNRVIIVSGTSVLAQGY